MLNFNSGSFSDLSETEVGKKLWVFFNGYETLIRFETATDLKRPALEAVQTQLLEKFGDQIRGNRWKQMMGRMVRQVMENNGYALDRTGVRTKDNILFSSAARYVKRFH